MIELKPTHPEVRKAIEAVETAMAEIDTVCFSTQDDNDPDLWSVQSAEAVPGKPDGYVIHTCFVGWSQAAKAVYFAGFDSGLTARNEKEGIAGDAGLEFTDLKSIEMVALWLTGDFHRILKSAQEKMVAMAEKAEKAAPKLADSIIESQNHAKLVGHQNDWLKSMVDAPVREDRT